MLHGRLALNRVCITRCPWRRVWTGLLQEMRDSGGPSKTIRYDQWWNVTGGQGGYWAPLHWGAPSRNTKPGKKFITKMILSFFSPYPHILRDCKDSCNSSAVIRPSLPLNAAWLFVRKVIYSPHCLNTTPYEVILLNYVDYLVALPGN